MMLDVKKFVAYSLKKTHKKKNPTYEFIIESLTAGRNVEISENGVIKYLTIIDGRLVTLTPKSK